MVVTATAVSGDVLTAGTAVLVSFVDAGRVVSVVEALNETVLSAADSGALSPQENRKNDKQNKKRKRNKSLFFMVFTLKQRCRKSAPLPVCEFRSRSLRI